MTCRRVRISLPGYVGGTLGERAASRVAAHVARCNAYGSEARKLALVVQTVSSLPKVRCAPTFTASVLRRVRIAEVPVPAARRNWGLRLAVAGSAAVVLTAVLVLPRVRESVQPADMQTAAASRPRGDEFVLPVAGPEDRLANWGGLGVWAPAQGQVRVSLVLDQNMTPPAAADQIYILDRQRGWASSLRSTL